MEQERVRESLRRHGYAALRLIGRGHFSEVYLVKDQRGSRFACKVSGNAALLFQEARCMGGLEHPLFPKYETFWQEDNGYLVMEYVPGRNLEEMRERRGGFPVSAVVRIGVELASGLGCLHEEHGRLYRDVKPANIILCEDGGVKLVDLGCVCPLGERAKEMAGTPGFAAPEQLRAGERLMESCDVYGLGRTLESLLGGGKGRKGVWRAIWKGRRLRRVIAACTKEKPQERLPDMKSAALALSRAEKGFRARRKGWEDELLRGRLQVQENIWKTSRKKA